MSSTRRNQIRRRSAGFSLLEVLIAGAVMLLGLTGITAMLIRGATNARNGQQMMVATSYANQVIADVEAARFESLIPMAGATFDAGTSLDAGYFIDGSGREYQASYIVTNVTPVGNLSSAYNVQAQVTYRDGLGREIYVQTGTILSKPAP